MKTFNILYSFLLFCFLINCSPVKREPKVDYNFNSDSSYKYIDLDYNRKQQTVILIDKKEATQADLNELVKKDKIKNLNIIKDSMEIKKLNYPTNKVKAIIVATKK